MERKLKAQHHNFIAQFKPRSQETCDKHTWFIYKVLLYTSEKLFDLFERRPSIAAAETQRARFYRFADLPEVLGTKPEPFLSKFTEPHAQTQDD